MERAKEHVLPQWLQGRLQIEDQVITPTHVAHTGERVSQRVQTTNELVDGLICAACNNGWLSRLESEVKPALIPLMAADTTVVELSPDQRQLIARWAAKTAWLLNLSSNYHNLVPSELLRSLRTGPPPEAYVLAQQHHGNRTYSWIQGGPWILFNAKEPQATLDDQFRNRLLKVSFQLGRLLLAVSMAPPSGWQLTIWRGIHVPLWPQTGKIGWYEREPFPWDDSEDALISFHGGLALSAEGV